MAFKFKQFEINDSKTAMKVGTDGTLVGAWADVSSVVNVLDIGAGCGLISLMIAQRTMDECMIDAVEIDNGACCDCKSNFEKSPWKERLSLISGNFNNIKCGNYDLIISNPPFFKNDLKSPQKGRALARQGGELNYFSLIEFSASHLNNQGRLVFISDTKSESEIEICALMNNFSISRKCYVKNTLSSAPKRVLWEMSKRKRDDEQPSKQVLPIINQDGDFSKEYKELTKDFYLKF